MTDGATTDTGSGWTEDRVEILKRLWGEGLSASQIAAQLGGGVTRNAVIGKVHRLGLSGRGKSNTPAQPRARKATRPPSHPLTSVNGLRGPAPVVRPPVAQIEADHTLRPAVIDQGTSLPVSERVTIMELRDTMCRWPIGDPTTAEFRFCGGRSITGLPYCTFHSRIAYQPAAERKRLRA